MPLLCNPGMIIYGRKKTAAELNRRLNKVSVSHTYTNPLLNYYTSARFTSIFVIPGSTGLAHLFLHASLEKPGGAKLDRLTFSAWPAL